MDLVYGKSVIQKRVEGEAGLGFPGDKTPVAGAAADRDAVVGAADDVDGFALRDLCDPLAVIGVGEASQGQKPVVGRIYRGGFVEAGVIVRVGGERVGVRNGFLLLLDLFLEVRKLVLQFSLFRVRRR